MNTMPRERTATPAELADEMSRTGQQRPRTLHAIAEQSAALIVCTHCGARPGKPCRPGSYHLARFISGFTQRMITPGEMADVIAAAPIVFTAASLIRGER